MLSHKTCTVILGVNIQNTALEVVDKWVAISLPISSTHVSTHVFYEYNRKSTHHYIREVSQIKIWCHIKLEGTFIDSWLGWPVAVQISGIQSQHNNINAWYWYNAEIVQNTLMLLLTRRTSLLIGQYWKSMPSRKAMTTSPETTCNRFLRWY